jgi:hypothetical protein
MKKLCIASGLIVLLLLPICSAIAVAGDRNDLARLEPTAVVDFDYVVLAKSSSTSVTADLSFPLSFQIIPVVVVGDGTGAFTASMTRDTTTGEIVYIYQKFPGAGVAAFNIGITPVTLRTSTAVTLGPGWAFGWVITGVLFSLEEPPYSYKVSLGF